MNGATYTDSASGSLGPIDSGLTFLGVRFIVCEFHSHVLFIFLVSVCALDTNAMETFSLRPSWGASTVMNKPLTPRAPACCTSFLVMFLSLLTYL